MDEDEDIINIDFISKYHIRLKNMNDDEMTYDEYISYVYGLLSLDGLLGNLYRVRSTPSEKYSELNDDEKKEWVRWRQLHPECVTHTKKLTLKDLYGDDEE